MKPKRRTRTVSSSALSVAVLLIIGSAQPVHADKGVDSALLRSAVSAENITRHLEELQAIADANDGNRAAGTSGHVASAEYIEAQLQAAGYETGRQYFTYPRFVVNLAVLAQMSPSPTTYTYSDDFLGMTYSGDGDVTAAVTAVDVNLAGDRASTSGCEASDFEGFPAGNIALIQRGTCTFSDKTANAEAAGASAVIIFNQGNVIPDDDRLGVVAGTLDVEGSAVAVVGTSFELGEELATTEGVEVRVALDTGEEVVETFNVLADTAGRPDRTVVVGAHLDGVSEGPGINDNGSGSAAILETAVQLAELGITPTNRTRFAFWSGEEDGLIGSDYYVSQLSPRDIKNHALNLNFDMIASPNPVRFVYDGDGGAFGSKGPNGSDVVEDVFLKYFAAQGLATAPTEFDGRSDYFGFIENGIPAGGLFTGAEGIKSEEEAAVFGGTAGRAYDPCYHAECDTISNIDQGVLEEMADAIAHATLTFAMTTSSVKGTAKGGGGKPGKDFTFKGNLSLR
ncbi:M20/M25/M40 family metallo-hydrolase [Arthrobacter agilis]|nr:aminopeptidase [Arthrobacter agilis]PPB47072.1 aminopeptidase [Arthrobacter agilis]TPV22485.1 M20/M25/M40 family metallo-hydrolase [Arthrobacter agilis]